MNSLASESKKRHRFERGSPLILPSLQEDPRIMGKDFDNTKILDIYPSITGDLQSLIIEADEPEHNGQRGILLIDDNETLRIESDTAFSKALNIELDKKIKVVSIFGNTGVGKSYTLNKLFFNGEEVFKTSPSQVSCTLGVWAKYDPTLNVLCLDTEGLLGLAPGVIIFHETQYTDTLHVLNNHPNVTAEDILRQNFADLGSNCEEFSFIKYIGVKTRDNQETSFDRLRAEIQKELESSNVRSARKAKYVYLMLKKCVRNGERSTVEPKYTKDNSWTSYLNLMWSGYVIHCPKCGVIYKSREHWYGNKNPEDCAVQLEVVHMWPG
ncbi:hypothetical protein YQE_00934, partial [Dendroctonus ponderosae]